MKYRVYVFFKNGILDPEAEAIKKKLFIPVDLKK